MHARGLRPRRARSMLAISHLSVSPSAHWNSVGALISDHFHGSIPCLHVPLSTLRVQPCDCPRMTRGQVGSLRLTCTTLAFATSRRFIPAHSDLGPFSAEQGICRSDLRFERLDHSPVNRGALEVTMKSIATL